MKPCNIYVASCTEKGGIYHYKMSGDGALQFVGKTGCNRPMYMVRADGCLHVLLRQPFETNEFSGIMTYQLDREGRLCNSAGPVSTQGRCGCHLCHFHENLYVANYLSGSIFCTDGTVITHEGHGSNPDRQEMPHPHCILPSPDGAYLMAADLGTDTIVLYDFALHKVSAIAMPGGTGPRHLINFNKEYVMCVNELDCSVTMLKYWKGKLIPVQTISVLGEQKTVQSASAAIRVRGNYVYVSNRGENTIAAVLVSNHTMALKSVTSCGGESPRDFDIAGDFILCSNEKSSAITVLKVQGEVLTLLPNRTIAGINRPTSIYKDHPINTQTNNKTAIADD